MYKLNFVDLKFVVKSEKVVAFSFNSLDLYQLKLKMLEKYVGYPERGV